jgi:hypothetical protein
MRERTTWKRDVVVKKAADTANNDIYTMNQDHPQPGHGDYVIGDSSDFAEDIHTPNTWDVEYSGEEVKRNEIGLPEMRSDTFSHSEKTASMEVLLKKADLCVEVANMMLAGKKTASAVSVEDQAVALMYLPDQELINTHTRLAADEDEDKGDEALEQAADQAKPEEGDQGSRKDKDGDAPWDKKDAAPWDKKEAQSDEDEEKKPWEKPWEKKEAQDQDGDGEDQDAKAENNWPEGKQASHQMLAQMQQMQAQLQQLIKQAQFPGEMPGDDLDQMLSQESCGPMAEADIQMDPAPMDMGDGEDEVLRNLFANDDDQVQVEVDLGDADQGQQQSQQSQQNQNKQARTASSRTVGTRPTAGVSKLGGSVSKTASSQTVDQLSSLWQSAPDVRREFGLK